MEDTTVSKVYFDRMGESGNIFCIMGMASAALKREGREADVKRMVQQVTCTTHSYQEALEVIAEYVDLIEYIRIGSRKNI